MFVLKGKRALVIDDLAHARTYMRATLNEMGLPAVDMAESANDAINRIKNSVTGYDIILSDYALDKGKDGQMLLEELRHTGLIPLSTIFIMTTAERSYERVAAAAELAPDDYLIKPFSPDAIQTRILRAAEKKAVFVPIYTMIEERRMTEALAACDKLIADKSKYIIDAMRLKAEVLTSEQRFDEAKAVYDAVLAFRAIPWARMGLAHVLLNKKEYAAAEEALEVVIAESPRYLEAYDMLADAQAAQEKLTEAKDTLKTATDLSPGRTLRFRKLGEVALRTGDLAAAEEAFSTVLDKGKLAHFHNPDDYINLSSVMMEKGDFQKALSVTEDARRNFDGPAGDFAATVAESLIHQRAGNEAQAAQSLDKAFALQKTHGLESPETTLKLARSCLANGREDEAKTLMRNYARNHHDSEELIGKARRMFEEAGLKESGDALIQASAGEVIQVNNEGVRMAQSGNLRGAAELLLRAAEQMPDNLRIVLNAAQVCLLLVEKEGWDQPMVTRAKAYIQEAQEKQPQHPKLAQLVELRNRVLAKFGADKRGAN